MDRLGIEYRVLDAAEIAGHFEPGSFDLVTSWVALQDVLGVQAAIEGTARLLRPGGRLVFAITHPCFDTPYREWERDAAGNKLALKVAGYFDESPMQFTWRGRFAYEFTTASHHVPFSRWFGWLREAGLDVEVSEEPMPSPEAIGHRPALADAAIVGFHALQRSEAGFRTTIAAGPPRRRLRLISAPPATFLPSSQETPCSPISSAAKRSRLTCSAPSWTSAAA